MVATVTARCQLIWLVTDGSALRAPATRYVSDSDDDKCNGEDEDETARAVLLLELPLPLFNARAKATRLDQPS